MKRLFVLFAAVLPSLAACQSQGPQEVAHRAELNWSAVVRGARLLPANPAQARLEVGDIRMVKESQFSLFAGKGTLRDPRGYADFGEPVGRLPVPFPRQEQIEFPPYVFAFDVAEGLDVGVPTRALGVAAGLTGMQGGFGTWTPHHPLSEAVDPAVIEAALRAWAKDHAGELGNLAPANGTTCRLRVIVRVVSAKQATLVVRGEEPWAGKRWDGYDNTISQVLDPVASPVDVAFRLEGLNKSVADTLKATARGGESVTVVAASSQTMTLVERLSQPMVVGYQVWDVPVGLEGSLGLPAPAAAGPGK